jgi:hypothetical protein
MSWQASASCLSAKYRAICRNKSAGFMVEACRGVGGMSLAEITKWVNQRPEYGLRMISWYSVAEHFRQ